MVMPILIRLYDLAISLPFPMNWLYSKTCSYYGIKGVIMNPEENMSMGELATRADCKAETVRYYEKEGLLPEPPRTEGGHRLYSRTHLKRLYFIRRSRELGFSVNQVRELLSFVDDPGRACGEVKAMALLQARNVQEKINDLKRLHKALTDMSVSCKGGKYSTEQCPIIDAIFREGEHGDRPRTS